MSSPRTHLLKFVTWNLVNVRSMGQLKAQTMKVQGTLHGHYVKILLDCGSTHNFVDTRLLKQWGQPIHHTKSFEVMIADGGKVKISGC